MNEEMYQKLHRLFADRANYWEAQACRARLRLSAKEQYLASYVAYDSALAMLEYAHDNNVECLAQFDCYGD